MSIEIREHVPLAVQTTMKVGGNARYFANVKEVSGIPNAVSWAKKENLPFFVLGGGSNTLVSDDGFPGLVIKIEIKGIAYVGMHTGVRAKVGAGEVWDDFVRDTVLRDVWGIENLSLIPGSVGGAVVQNIGAYGVEVRQSIVEVEAFDIEKGEIKIFSGHKCKFGYRDSIFKNNKNLIVTHVVFDLARNGKPHTDYEDVKVFFSNKGITNPTIQNIRDAIIEIRTTKMPGSNIGSAGSFFKNPIVSMAVYEDLKRAFPEIKAHLQGDNTVKLSAAWLLDKVGGYRGVRRGGAGVWEKQALILVNHGDAKAEDVLSLAHEIKQTIKEKTNVTLDEEVIIL